MPLMLMPIYQPIKKGESNMASHTTNPLHKGCSKGTKVNQLAATFEGFFKAPATMLQVAKSTDIERANICRYVASLRNQGSIAFVKKGYCPITKHMAGYYTTNPVLFPTIPKQLNLFTNE